METLNMEAFNPKKAELIALADKYKPTLSIEIIDKKTYDQVHDAQMELRDVRVNIEKTGKDLRAEALSFQKKVIEVEKDLLSTIAPIEDELKEKKEAYNKEQERIKEEEAKKKEEVFNNRVNALAQYGYIHDAFDLKVKSQEDFDILLAGKKKAHEEVETARIQQEENDRIAREEMAKKQADLDAREQAIIAKEKEETDRQAKIARENELEETRKQAERDTEDRLKKEADLKELNEKRAEEARIQGEKEEQENLAKKKKYIAFLESIGMNQSNKDEFTFIDTDEGRVFYKKIGIYKK